MDLKFKKYADALHPKFELLVAMAPKKIAQLVKREVPKCGIYLFTEGERHMYVGRSDNIRNRLGQHTRPNSPQNQASFAFLLAREEMGFIAVYKQGEFNRSRLLDNEEFRDAFARAKKRVRNMDVRFVEEEGPTAQALLEVYASVALETPYNSFRNH